MEAEAASETTPTNPESEVEVKVKTETADTEERERRALLDLVNEVAQTANALSRGGLHMAGQTWESGRLWAALAKWRDAAGIPGDTYPLAALRESRGTDTTRIEGWVHGDYAGGLARLGMFAFAPEATRTDSIPATLILHSGGSK